MKIYIAGPITGVPDYREKFKEVENKLTAQGHIVINPAMLPQGLGDCDTYMSICLPMIDVADAVVFLPGWKESIGACREWGYATALDKIIVDWGATE